MFPAASFTSMAPTSYKNVLPTLKNFNLIVCIEDLLVLWFMYFPYWCSCTLNDSIDMVDIIIPYPFIHFLQ